MRIAYVKAVAIKVFKDEKEVEKWLSDKQPALKGQTPYEAIQDENGLTEVMKTLKKMEAKNVKLNSNKA